MRPGDDRAMANRYDQLRPALLDFLGGQLSRQKQVVPAHDGIFDQPPAGLGDLLVFLLALNEFMAVAEGHALENLFEPSTLLSCFSIACRNSRSSMYFRMKSVFGILPNSF